MKITVNIKCSPEEARAFFGLPDVTPIQEEFVDALRQRMTEAIAGMDPEAMIKAWTPGGIPGMEQWMKMWKAGDGGK